MVKHKINPPGRYRIMNVLAVKSEALGNIHQLNQAVWIDNHFAQATLNI